jgi:hypothetical protein
MLIVPTTLNGYEIEAVDGRLGTVKDFLFDDRTWRTRWVVVDTGGWLTGRRVLIHPSALHTVDHEAKVFRVDLTQNQVKNSPTIEEHQPITMETERSQFDYYSWDPFWGNGMAGTMPGGSLVGATAMVPGDGTLLADQAAGYDGPDPHLRSIEDIRNYHVEATDGDLGHVQNMLVEDLDFRISYLVINTSDWWMGKTVLMSPRAVVDLKAGERILSLNVTRDQIKSSPPWDPADNVTPEMEASLGEHYNWPGSR